MYINYGQYASDQLLQLYGFVDQPTDNETYEIVVTHTVHSSITNDRLIINKIGPDDDSRAKLERLFPTKSVVSSFIQCWQHIYIASLQIGRIAILKAIVLVGRIARNLRNRKSTMGNNPGGRYCAQRASARWTKLFPAICDIGF